MLAFNNWATADALGVLATMPLALSLGSPQMRSLFQREALPKTLGLLTLSLAGAELIFSVSSYSLLFLLYPLLLLHVFLLQLLGLLLVPLLHLLLSGLVGVLLLRPLMLLLLLLLELLTILLLFGDHLILLLLILLIPLRVAGVGRSRTFNRRKLLGMDRRPRRIAFAARRVGFAA